MLLLGVLALTVGPFLFGPWSFVLALGCFTVAALDPVGVRAARRAARRRHTWTPGGWDPPLDAPFLAELRAALHAAEHDNELEP